MSAIKQNIIYNSILTTSNLIFPFITFPYVNRILNPEGIGVVNFANSFIQIFVILCSLGIPFYGIREIAKVRDDVSLRSKLVWELTFLKLCCFALILIVYIALIFTVPKFNNMLPFFLWGITSILLSVLDFNYFFTAIENFKFITIRTVAFQIVSVFLTFVLIKTPQDTLKYFLLPIIILLLNTLVNLNYLRKFVSWNGYKLIGHLKRHYKPLLLLFSILLFSSVYNLMDTTILGFMAGDDSVGFYSTVYKINRVPISIIMVVAPVLIPKISVEFSQGNFSEIERLLSKTLRLNIFVGVALMFGVVAIAPEIVEILAGKAFEPSVVTLTIMSPLALIIGITTCFSTQFLVPAGKDNLLMKAVLFGTVISIILNVVLINFFRHNGSAAANIITEIIVLLLCYYYASKSVSVKLPLGFLLKNILVCLPFVLIAYAVRTYSPLGTVPDFLLIIVLCTLYFFLAQKYILKSEIYNEIENFALSKLKR